MSFSFNAALSGLNASSNALNVVGNNIANANTIGFRSGQATFMDVFANHSGARLNGAGNSIQIGDGVQIGAVHTNLAEGNLVESTSPLHAAIQGNGFFIVKNGDGSSAYTRAGDFTVDNKGFLISSTGGQVQGFAAVDGKIPAGATISSLQLPLGKTLAPKVTTEGSLRMNLNSGAATASDFHATMQVYDSLGGQHNLDMTFTKQADGSFKMSAKLDGHDAQADVDGGGAAATPVDFTFDSNGNLTAPATSLAIVPDQTQLGTATLPSININLFEKNADGTQGDANFTSFAKASAVSTTKQDGYAAGDLNGAAVDQDGNIYGIFSNGQSRIVGQYALASFNSAEGLGRSGGNMMSETTASGQATIGAANTGGRGSIAGGYLEQSNVNITNEFVDLIEAQRGFQANSRVITSLNQTFQDLLQIV